jgi:hypothetical protein
MLMKINCVDNARDGKVCWYVEGERRTLCNFDLTHDQSKENHYETHGCEGCSTCPECSKKMKKIKDGASRVMTVVPEDINVTDDVSAHEFFSLLLKVRIEAVEENMETLSNGILSLKMAYTELDDYLGRLKASAEVVEGILNEHEEDNGA